ncbi:MAG: hypothetical protein HDR09_13030 [Lachnospiraceae bacterium]|nr:hypothetical protein [Lachnospiraceae bacterium]
MYRNNFGNCRGCGRQVLWIRTKAGKNMPVDTAIHHYREDSDGKEKIVTPGGDVVTGTIVNTPEEADGMGYISHFATCPQAGYFKSRAAR